MMEALACHTHDSECHRGVNKDLADIEQDIAEMDLKSNANLFVHEEFHDHQIVSDAVFKKTPEQAIAAKKQSGQQAASGLLGCRRRRVRGLRGTRTGQ
jgi:hypothetical protein